MSGGTASPASAAAAHRSSVSADPGPRQLRAALLTVADLPPGYRKLTLPGGMHSALTGPDTMMGPDTGGTPLSAATAMLASRIARPASEAARLGVAARDTRTTPMALAAFIKGDEGPLLMQAIIGTGDEVARDFVATVEKMAACCPVIVSDDLRITLRPMRGVPRLGDASLALAMTVTIRQEGFDLTVRGNLVVLAYDGVYEEIVQVGTPESMRDSRFPRIARTAFSKLVLA
jgi:hypothetical protein